MRLLYPTRGSQRNSILVSMRAEAFVILRPPKRRYRPNEWPAEETRKNGSHFWTPTMGPPLILYSCHCQPSTLSTNQPKGKLQPMPSKQLIPFKTYGAALASWLLLSRVGIWILELCPTKNRFGWVSTGSCSPEPWRRRKCFQGLNLLAPWEGPLDSIWPTRYLHIFDLLTRGIGSLPYVFWKGFPLGQPRLRSDRPGYSSRWISTAPVCHPSIIVCCPKPTPAPSSFWPTRASLQNDSCPAWGEARIF